MLKLKKILTSIFASAIVLSASAITANAASLANSFYSGTYTEGGDFYCDRFYNSYQYFTKTCYAGTVGYSGWHYVRAYIGGSKSGPNSSTVADTDRQWFSGDNCKSCQYTKGLPVADIWGDAGSYLPRGYAKYGN